MAQEYELSDFTNVHELQGSETNSGNTQPAERRLLRIGIVTLAVLCVIQATLNISLRLALYSKEDAEQLPLNPSMIAELCQTDQFQENTIQACSCCNNLLRSIVREYNILKTQRDLLVSQLNANRFAEGGFSSSGSGSLEELLETG